MTECVFKPSNVLTFETVQDDSIRLEKLLSQQSELTRLRFNLAEVTHCDSTGLALLLEAKRYCNQHQLEFLMEHMSASLRSLAEFCGLNTVLV
jgi:phospholipid transport system transporter-binding protein